MKFILYVYVRVIYSMKFYGHNPFPNSQQQIQKIVYLIYQKTPSSLSQS